VVLLIRLLTLSKANCQYNLIEILERFQFHFKPRALLLKCE